MIGNRVENPSDAALLVRQARKLTIRIVENVRHHLEKDAQEIDDKSAIEIKMTGNDPNHSTDESNSRRREIYSRKKPR